MISSMKQCGIGTMIMKMALTRRIISLNSSLKCEATIRVTPHPKAKLDGHLKMILDRKALRYSNKVLSDRSQS